MLFALSYGLALGLILPACGAILFGRPGILVGMLTAVTCTVLILIGG